MIVAQTMNGHNALPMGMTQTAPALPESPCSVNGFFQVEGFARDFQATGRGHTPHEAAANLKQTIDETRAAFAPPAPPKVRLADLLACGIEKAVKAGDLGRVNRLAKAATMVLDGSVEACAIEGRYTVKSSTQSGVSYDVTSVGVCGCKDYAYRATTDPHFFCCHSLAVMMVIRLAEPAA